MSKFSADFDEGIRIANKAFQEKDYSEAKKLYEGAFTFYDAAFVEKGVHPFYQISYNKGLAYRDLSERAPADDVSALRNLAIQQFKETSRTANPRQNDARWFLKELSGKQAELDYEEGREDKAVGHVAQVLRLSGADSAEWAASLLESISYSQQLKSAVGEQKRPIAEEWNKNIHNTGDMQFAERDYKRLLVLDPENVAAHEGLGGVFRDKAKAEPAKAVEHYRTALTHYKVSMDSGYAHSDEFHEAVAGIYFDLAKAEPEKAALHYRSAREHYQLLEGRSLSGRVIGKDGEGDAITVEDRLEKIDKLVNRLPKSEVQSADISEGRVSPTPRIVART